MVNSEDVNMKATGKSIWIWKVILYTYLIGILLLIMLPLSDVSSSLLTDNYVVTIRLDYLLHVILFLPFILLVRLTYLIPVLYVLLAGLVFAGICEGIQYLLPYRSFNINDLIANGIGVVAGIVLVVKPVYERLHRRVSSENVNGEKVNG